MKSTSVMVAILVLGLAAQAHSKGNLVDEILKNSEPNKMPPTSPGQPLNVSVGLILLSIKKLDFTTQEVEIDAWLDIRWNSGLTLDPALFSEHNITDIDVPASSVWRPDIDSLNGVMTFTNSPVNDKLIVLKSGLMLWYPKVNIRALCDVAHLRTDVQANATCSVKLCSWSKSESQIFLGSSPKLEAHLYFAGSNFHLLDTSAKKSQKVYPCCEQTFGDVAFDFTFKIKYL